LQICLEEIKVIITKNSQESVEEWSVLLENPSIPVINSSTSDIAMQMHTKQNLSHAIEAGLCKNDESDVELFKSCTKTLEKRARGKAMPANKC
jgi:hypothetical protein